MTDLKIKDLNLNLDLIPESGALSQVFSTGAGVGRPNLPTVDLPSDFTLVPAEPFASGKTTERQFNLHYHRADIPSDSDLSLIASKGKNPRTLRVVPLRYAEISETYLGSDGEYYVATFTRVYTPAKSAPSHTPFFEHQGTLIAPGQVSLNSFEGEPASVVRGTYEVTADEFTSIRRATSQEIAAAEDRREFALENGFELNSDGTFEGEHVTLANGQVLFNPRSSPADKPVSTRDGLSNLNDETGIDDRVDTDEEADELPFGAVDTFSSEEKPSKGPSELGGGSFPLLLPEGAFPKLGSDDLNEPSASELLEDVSDGLSNGSKGAGRL